MLLKYRSRIKTGHRVEPGWAYTCYQAPHFGILTQSLPLTTTEKHFKGSCLLCLSNDRDSFFFGGGLFSLDREFTQLVLFVSMQSHTNGCHENSLTSLG